MTNFDALMKKNKLSLFFPEVVCGWLKSDVLFAALLLCLSVILFQPWRSRLRTPTIKQPRMWKCTAKWCDFCVSFTTWKRRHKCKIRGSLKMDVNIKISFNHHKSFSTILVSPESQGLKTSLFSLSCLFFF